MYRRLVSVALFLQSSVSLTRHPLVGYWHDFSNPAGSTYPLHQISADWDVILVAFASALGNGSVGLTLDPNAGSEATFLTDVATLQASGKIVALSLGGQNGAVSLSDATETANFVSSVYDILTKYGFDGIDLDLENGVSQGLPIINNLISALMQLKQKIGASFYLSMAPEHPYVQGGFVAFSGIWGAYLPIIDGLRNELTQIHVQYYNNGGFVYTDGRTLNEGTVDCLVGGSLMLIEGFQTNYGTGWTFNGLRPDQVSFGVPSGPSSASRGFVTPETVKRALTCLVQGVACDTIKPKATYPTYRGVMTWSINWDSHDGYAFSKPARQSLDYLGGGTPTSASPTPSFSPASSTAAPPSAAPITPPPSGSPVSVCGACTNCYYAPSQSCFAGWTQAQCVANPAYTWCGEATRRPTPKQLCGACTNCYYPPTRACYSGWTAAQCLTNPALTWCGY